MDGKPALAMYWAAGCGGCEIAVLNIHEAIFQVDANFEIVLWPLAVDAKYHDVKALPDQSIAICLFDGAIRSSENEAMARLLRQKSKILVAFGSCACEGGIPGLANLSTRETLFESVFQSLTTENPDQIIPQPLVHVPEGDLELPVLYETVKSLEQVVLVDYYLPGCPPESPQIAAVVELVIAALHGKPELPPSGSVIGAGDSTVCDECTRQRHEKSITSFKRTATAQPEPDLCLLEQGFLCAGMATRSGCQARCPSANAPCIGCYGAPTGVLDQGARMISALGSIIDAKTLPEADKVLENVVDPAGSFYRFGLARSYLHRARRKPGGGDLCNA